VKAWPSLAFACLLGAAPSLAVATPDDRPGSDPAKKTEPAASKESAPTQDAGADRPRKAVRPKTLLMSANEAISRALPKLLEKPGDTAYRISVAGGLVGVGAYDARGGSGDGSINGIKAAPLQLFPRAGAGNSLNIDPVTGRMR